MADKINGFVDNLELNALNSLTHLLNTEDTDELNIIQHSRYYSDDELIQSRMYHNNGLSILSLNCQSLHSKFEYIKLLLDKFSCNNCPLHCKSFVCKKHGLQQIQICHHILFQATT